MNFQNVPIRDEEYKRVRRLFVAPPGYDWLTIDFGQVELRTLAQACQDPRMLEEFVDPNADPHRMRAEMVSEMFGIPYTQALRRFTKSSFSFAAVFGAEVDKIYATANKERIPLTRDGIGELLSTLRRMYPRIETYRREVHQSILRTEEARTLFGRVRYFPGIRELNRWDREAALRAGFTVPVQGTAADLFKRGLAALREVVDWKDVQIINLVHDSYEHYVRKEVLTDYAKQAKLILEHQILPDWWNVPIVAEFSAGPNWADREVFVP